MVGCAGPGASSPSAHERSACEGVPEDESRAGLFKYQSAVERVDPLFADSNGKVPPNIAGARIYLHAVPGLTPEWLGRVLECHLSHPVPCPSNEACPLEVGPMRLDVRSTGNGYVVNAQAKGPESAAEVLRRARKLRDGA